MPVLAVVVRSPDHVRQAEHLQGINEARLIFARPRSDWRSCTDLLGDGSNSVVAVSVRGPPEGGDLAVVRVGEDLHRPSELGDDSLVGEGRHVRVRPRVNSKVLAGDVASLEEDVGVADNVATLGVGGKSRVRNPRAWNLCPRWELTM